MISASYESAKISPVSIGSNFRGKSGSTAQKNNHTIPDIAAIYQQTKNGALDFHSMIQISPFGPSAAKSTRSKGAGQILSGRKNLADANVRNPAGEKMIEF